MIKGRNPGDNITLMNTLFRRSTDPKDGKFKDFLTIVYKDLDTGLKFFEEIINPDYEYFVINPDKRVPYNRLFVPKSDVESVVVPYRDLEKDMHEAANDLDFEKAALLRDEIVELKGML